MNIARACIIAVCFVGFGCVSSHPSALAAPQARPQPDRPVYRVDFVVAANDPGKPAQTSSYTINLEESNNGEIHLGSNVQLSTQARQDVGLKIKANVHAMQGEDVILRGSLEMSGLDEPISAESKTTTIHRISAQGDALLHPGQSVLVASLEDPLSHKHYQVSASATRLR